jgi:tetratricopeptide (TPR) repeat protein
VHSLFVGSQLCLALADMKKANYPQAIKHLEESKDYPERLGTGKPYNPDYRMQDYLLSFCYEKMGDRRNLEAARKRISDYAPSRGSREKPEALKQKVDQWYQTVFPKQDERKALDALTQLIREIRDRTS